MQHKLVLWWKGGSVEVAKNGVILIRQGTNVIEVTPEEKDAFLLDVENAPAPKPIPGVGFGGTISPLPTKPKSMHELTQKLLYIGKGWHSLK
jgi:hypothetical protein